MIVFDLSCPCGCQFEGWFQSREDFNRQKGAGLISCPGCGGNEVKKILSPVSIKSVAGRKFDSNSDNVLPEQLATDIIKKLQNHVINNYEDVGSRLAEESLKIHYGLEKPRKIRGISTREDEKILKKEGIELLKIPLPVKSDKKLN